jgi:superfamily II DNA or RNA helicase
LPTTVERDKLLGTFVPLSIRAAVRLFFRIERLISTNSKLNSRCRTAFRTPPQSIGSKAASEKSSDRRSVMKSTAVSRKAENFVLLATASLIGEGYDLPRLDTLFLAMPLSFKGRLIQYAGRLHRSHADKREIRVYDYLDEGNPLTMAMFRRRSSAYQQMGYRMVMDGDTAGVSLDFG